MLKTLLTAAVFAAAAGGASANSVKEMRWEKRIVIVFATAGDARVGEQERKLLTDKAALIDRDLLAFAVIGDELSPIHGVLPVGDTAAALRDRYDIAPDTAFTAVLIGKDGGVNWRGNRLIGLAQLTGIIDAMPMRRNGG